MVVPQLSILIASLRPDVLLECVESIEKNTEDYELLIHDKPGGIYQGTNELFRRSRGKYVVHIPDDCVVCGGWSSNMVRFMYSGKVNLCSFQLKIDGFDDPPLSEYFGVKYASYICIERDYAKRIGGLFDERFNSFYGDPDLSLRSWVHGYPAVVCPDACIISRDRRDLVHEESYNKYHDIDRDQFLKKWGHLEHKRASC